MPDLPDAAITAELRDKVAIALHDRACNDRTCSGSALGGFYEMADVALEAAAPALRAQGAATERARIRQLVTPELLSLLVDAGAVSVEWAEDVADLLDGGDG